MSYACLQQADGGLLFYYSPALSRMCTYTACTVQLALTVDTVQVTGIYGASASTEQLRCGGVCVLCQWLSLKLVHAASSVSDQAINGVYAGSYTENAFGFRAIAEKNVERKAHYVFYDGLGADDAVHSSSQHESSCSRLTTSLKAYSNEDFAGTMEELCRGDKCADKTGGASDVAKKVEDNTNSPPPLIIHRRRTRVLPTRPIEPVTAATPAASTQLISSVGTPVATTETGVPTTSPSTKKPLPLGSLICTVQTPFGNNFAHAPPDGLCTIIMAYPFYGYQAITLDPALYEFEGVSSILDVAEKQTKTEYGIGIDFNFCGSLHDMTMLLKDRGTELAMRLLWTKRVYHYGQINPPLGRQDNLTTLISNCGKGLQMISDVIKRLNNNVALASYTIFSYPLFVPDNFATFGAILSATPVDIFIAEGYHTEEDTAYDKCRMIPPTLLSKELLEPDLYASYTVRLANTIWSMTVNPQAWSPRTTFAVSVGMAGRWYRPKRRNSDSHGAGNYQLGKPCENEQRGDIGQQTSGIDLACSFPSYKNSFTVDTTFQAMVGYDKVQGWLFTFDTAETLRYKLCEAKSNVTALRLNLVASDIGSEDYTDICGFGAVSRLRMLKAVSLFFAHNYTSSAEKSICLTVTG
ncbi:uncharacterized protein LOC142796290 isoform X2 [Rhipicephalus microplus]|uniref:uncharacterized protein LOC142796290 isoform X2 n=1 Tax=Rhipicephalus microplus TaxID=6941 RepID=UPI003F6D81C8